MPPEGGLRDRIIHESLFNAINTELDTLGWFDAGREHADITMIDEFPDLEGDTPINTIAFSMGDGGGVLTEMGSALEDHEIIFFCDFFAEDDSIGRHVRGDIFDFLKTNPSQPIFDYSDIGDPEVFKVEVQDDIDKRKPERAVNKWQKHWYVVSFSVIDYGRPHT